MTIRNSRPTRREVRDRVEDARREMRNFEDEAGIVADDHDTVNHTLANLEYGGTQDGVDDVALRIEGARDSTERVFGEKDQQLDGAQDTALRDKTEVDQRLSSSASDHRKILDASQRIHTRETLSEMARAGESAQHEIEFLNDTIRTALANLHVSEDAQQVLRSRVYGRRST